jgi:hypothetical protein
MKRLRVLLAAGLVLSLSGCAFHRKPQVAKAAPPPKPVTAPAPAPLPQPLSIPQTNVQLPPSQPLSPEALATTEPHEEAPAAVPPRTPPRRTVQAAPKPVEAVAPPPVTVTPAPEERQPIQEVLPPGEVHRLAEETDARKRDTLRVLEQVQPQRLTATQRQIVDRVQAFLKQSDDAKQRGDMRQASELAGRALVLAKELQP